MAWQAAAVLMRLCGQISNAGQARRCSCAQSYSASVRAQAGFVELNAGAFAPVIADGEGADGNAEATVDALRGFRLSGDRQGHRTRPLHQQRHC